MKLRIAKKILKKYADGDYNCRLTTFAAAVRRVSYQEYIKHARRAVQTVMRERQQ